jgi:hypothetical protein
LPVAPPCMLSNSNAAAVASSTSMVIFISRSHSLRSQVSNSVALSRSDLPCCGPSSVARTSCCRLCRRLGGSRAACGEGGARPAMVLSSRWFQRDNSRGSSSRSQS